MSDRVADAVRVVQLAGKEKFLARTYIMKACHHRYEKLQEDLHNDLGKRTNNYPNTLDAAFCMINKHRDRANNRSTGVNHTMSFMTDSDDKKKKEEEKKKKKK
eukprot:4014543-Ditylum_brightwellii.AAC.1